MIFSPPALVISAVEQVPSAQGVRLSTTRGGGLNAVYRGTVISTDYNEAGLSTIAIQHPNDFVSIISGVAETYVRKGDKVTAGQRLGRSDATGIISFELWHKGSSLDPAEYIPLQ